MSDPSQRSDAPRTEIPELLPCPFCGNDAAEETIIDKNEGVAYTPWYQAVCRQCDFWLPGSRDEAEAIAEWNRRASSALLASSDSPRAEIIKSLFAFASRAYTLLDCLSDDDECARDHHGACQTHLGERNCSNAAARALLDAYSEFMDDAESAMAALLAGQRDGERLRMLRATDDIGDDLDEAQAALVALADQLERHSIPFVPAAEAATFKAREALAQEERLLARGLEAAKQAFANRAPSAGASDDAN